MMESKKDYLKNVDLFGQLSDNERTIVEQYFQIRPLEKGQYLFKQGGVREALFIILEGEIDLNDESLGRERTLVTCGEGTVLGEPSLIEEGKYGLNGLTVSTCKVAQMSKKSIDELENSHPQIYTKLVVSMAKLLANRLTISNRGDRGLSNDFATGEIREEHDLLGNRNVPHNVLWGVQTLRAIENFNISGVRLDLFPEMIESLALIKECCAEVNFANNQLDKEIYEAIIKACNEIKKGMWHRHFPIDMIQGGAGTSTNMNANEVIANRALNILGYPKGHYTVIHPNIHVNMCQSTNDVYPSAIHLTILTMSKELLSEIELLSKSFNKKAKEFSHIIKMGRTQLQDAVPMTLGQEFKAWSGIIKSGGQRIKLALNLLRRLNMGGTAIGTGLNAPKGFSEKVIIELNKKTDLQLKKDDDLIMGTQDTSSLVEFAGVLKMLAIRLSKICNDLRLLSSGPKCGLNEINLPAMQPGSSIMPGKVNPVIPEVVNQVAFQVIGLDTSVAMASEGGQLELNVFEPLIAFNLFSSIKMLKNAMKTLRLSCIDGISANEEVCRKMVQGSIGIVTALNPVLGYEQTSQIAAEATKSGKSVYELVLDKNLLSESELNDLLTPQNMV